MAVQSKLAAAEAVNAKLEAQLREERETWQLWAPRLREIEAARDEAVRMRESSIAQVGWGGWRSEHAAPLAHG